MSNDRIIGILYGVSLAVHSCVCFHIANTEPVSCLIGAAMYLLSIYENMGFHWSRDVAYLLSSGMISGIILNTVRRTVEGMVLGWPRFKDHDKSTFFRFWLRCLLWVGLAFFAFGAWGSNETRNFEKLHALDAGHELGGTMHVFSIALASFIYGGVVNVIDDAISATYFILKRRDNEPGS
ncbi:MAG: hypothetical protein LBQ62_08120 [Candidatus Accumulibacter sp.]|jgi:hypothetical protein|nr:hypothetical protein [Accumulibacter sp.]